MARPAFLLGWLGVLPFAALSVLAAIGSSGSSAEACRALTLYGAIILSFMGGAQWGVAMVARGGEPRSLGPALTISVLPALGAFAISFLSSAAALLGLMAGFLALLAYETATARDGLLPDWYSALRRHLTIAVVACLGFAAVFGCRP